MTRVVNDIVFGFQRETAPEQSAWYCHSGATSIYEACKYFELFQKTVFKGKCGCHILQPAHEGYHNRNTPAPTSDTDKEFIYNTYTELLKAIDARPGMTKTETYEDTVKGHFKKQPANMKLLIVVNKLLTGFDAPSCTLSLHR